MARKGSRKEDRALADRLAKFKNDPLGFVLFAFDWGHGDLEGEEGPDEWQRQFLIDLGNDLGDRIDLGAIRYATASGHGVGKSALTAWIIIWAMTTRPHLNAVVTANTSTQLETKTWRELAIWYKRAINAHWFKWSATKFYQVDHPETWYAAAIPWREEKSEAFAGTHGKDVLMIYDEASAVADVIWEVSEGAMTDKGAMFLVFGNPTRNTGKFAECFKSLSHRWKCRQIDSTTTKRANLPQIQEWLEDYGEDSDFIRVRVQGQFPRASSTQFIPVNMVDEAIAREDEENLDEPLIMGVDVGRYGDDKSVILLRRGRVIEHIEKYPENSIPDLVDNVAKFIEEREPAAVIVDGAAVGGGVVDGLERRHFKVIEHIASGRARDSTEYVNRRAECWAKMKQWLLGGSIPDDKDLKEELISPEYGYDSQMRLQLEKKEDMKKRGKRSPDTADALALTFAERIKPDRDRYRSQTRAESTYDPFAM